MPHQGHLAATTAKAATSFVSYVLSPTTTPNTTQSTRFRCVPTGLPPLVCWCYTATNGDTGLVTHATTQAA